MNIKRVKSAIMSAVILSAIALSGCSSEGTVSYNESGGKTDDVSVSSTLSHTSAAADKDVSEKAGNEASSADSKPASSAESQSETTRSATKAEWKETKAEGTKYVSVDCYSRKNAILGAETVRLYSTNEKVEVVAITDTGYCKLKDGTFIHSDYLSDSKVTVTTATTTASTAATAKATTYTTTKKPEKPKPSQSQTSEFSWVIKPSYVYDDVAVLLNMSNKPTMNMRLWDDAAEDNDSGLILPVAYVISQNNSYGLIAQNGDMLMNCEYEFIGTFSRFIEALKADSSFSYTIGSDYKVHIMKNFGHGGGDSSYYTYDMSNGRIGYVNPVDVYVFDKEDAEETFAYRAAVLKSGTIDAETNSIYEDENDKAKFGLMYRNKIIVPLIYDGGCDGNLVEFDRDSLEMCDVKDGRAVFWKNNKIYVFDKEGNCYSDGVYDKADNRYQEINYFNGYLPVCKNGKWGLIDVNGNEVLKCQFEDITSVYGGKAWAKQNGKWGVIKLA